MDYIWRIQYNIVQEPKQHFAECLTDQLDMTGFHHQDSLQPINYDKNIQII